MWFELVLFPFLTRGNLSLTIPYLVYSLPLVKIRYNCIRKENKFEFNIFFCIFTIVNVILFLHIL